MPTNRPNVEKLIAYAKGGLPRAEAREIERFLERNTEARQLIEAFWRSQGLAATAGQSNMPQAETQHVGHRGPSSPRDKGEARTDAAPRAGARLNWTKAIAGSIAVLAGMASAAFLLAGRDERQIALRLEEKSPIAPGRLSSIDALSAALTQLASGTPGMAGDRGVTILMTFRDSTNRNCRKFEISDPSPTASRVVAVACRDGGAWWIEGGAWLSPGGANSAGEPASASSQDADGVAGLLERIGAGAALDREEEVAVIARSWEQ